MEKEDFYKMMASACLFFATASVEFFFDIFPAEKTYVTLLFILFGLMACTLGLNVLLIKWDELIKDWKAFL